MAILLPGEIFRDSYKEADVAPYVLSRTLEDGGTIFSYLIPWSAAAIYVSSTLGVTTLDYLPYAFLPILCPIFAIIYAATGFALFKTNGAPVKGRALVQQEGKAGSTEKLKNRFLFHRTHVPVKQKNPPVSFPCQTASVSDRS